MDILYTASILCYFCTVGIAAPPLTPPSLSLLNTPKVNLTAPLSVTQPLSANRLPPDPFIFQVPSSDETVRFYSYGSLLPRPDVIHAISSATREIAMHGSSDEPIPDRIIRYGFNKVYILLHHNGRMTWRVWETALRGIVVFLEKYEYVDMEFDIGQIGLEQFYGTGALGILKNDVLQ